jgi:hypothetical protein
MPSNHLQIHPRSAEYLSTAFMMAYLRPIFDRMALHRQASFVAAVIEPSNYPNIPLSMADTLRR